MFNNYNRLKRKYKIYNNIYKTMKDIYEENKEEETKEYINYIFGVKNGIKISMNELKNAR